mgnify:CR=1 FL=1
MNLIAHRGLSSQAPENTFASFDASVNNNFNIIEFDVQLTRDNMPVIFHDSDLNRTTNGSGAIKEMNLKELQMLDAGSWFDKKFEREKIPLLEDVLNRYHGKCHFQIELKSDESNLPQIVLNMLKNTNWLNNYSSNPYSIPGFSITSFDINHIIKFKNLYPRINVGWLYKSNMDIDGEVLSILLENKINMIIPNTKSSLWANIEMQKKISDKNITICAWGAENIKEVAMINKTLAKGMTVNWPDKAKENLF